MIIPNNIKLLKKSEANKYYYNEGKILPSFEKNKIEPGGSVEFIIDCFKTTKIKVKNILEIGCANGRKLEKYKAYFKNKKLNVYKMNLKNFIEASNLFKSIYLHKWEISNTFKKKFISSDISVALFQKINFEQEFPKNL